MITSVSDLVGNSSTAFPKTSIGSQGDYAINTTHVTNKIYKKTASNTWVHVGSQAWHNSLPVFTVASGTTVTNSATMVINGTTVTTGGTALSDVATAINTSSDGGDGAALAGISASVNSVTGNLEIFHNGGAFGDSSAGDNTIRIEEGSGLLAELGITAGTYNGVKFLQAAHTSRPTWKTADENRPNGSVWFKTTSANSGANIVAKLYSSASGSFSTVSAPLHATHHQAIFKLDAANGGTALSAGDLYTQFNITEQTIDGQADTTGNVGDFQLFRYEGGKTVIQSKTTNPSFTANETFTVRESLKNQEALDTAKTVTMISGDGSTLGDAEDFLTAFTTANFTNLVAEKITTGEYKGAIKITHKLGGEFRMNNTSGTPLDDAGFGTGSAHSYGGFTANSSTLVDNLYVAPAGDSEDSTVGNEVAASNWKRLSYTASTSEPTNEPADGTLWYNTSLDADIMAHNGTTFVGYKTAYSSTDPEGPQFSATAPKTYNTAATLSSTNTANQVAVTTTGAAWELVDKTDQTTEDGIVFADARWQTTTEKNANGNEQAGTASSIKDLLTDGHLDPDAPDPALYPNGILLFNTRRSGYNVKEYKNDYINILEKMNSSEIITDKGHDSFLLNEPEFLKINLSGFILNTGTPISFCILTISV